MRVEQEKTNIPLHQVFLQIVTDFGEDVLKGNRLIALLSDLGGSEFNQYKFIVRCSIEKGIGNQILEMKDLDEADRMLKIGNLKQSLIDEYSLQEDKVNYIFNCYLYALGVIKDIEQIDNSAVQNTDNTPISQQFDEANKLKNNGSYIKINDPSLTNLPIFAEILNIIRAIGHFDINEYTRIYEYGMFDWYEKLPEEIQQHYGVRPELPPKERFEYVGDLIKYIIQKNELSTKEKLSLPSWGKFAYILPAPFLISLIGKVWLNGKIKYDQIMLTMNDTKWREFRKKAEIRNAADDEITWIYILVFFSCIAIGLYYRKLIEDNYHFENGILGYFLKFAIMMILVSVTMQWWPAIVIATIELIVRYSRFNKTDGECFRKFVNKFIK